LTLCWRSVDALLTLCWHSVDALLTLCWHSVDALLTLCWHSVDALLTLCWRSVDALLTLCWRSVDALLTRIFRMWLGAWVCVFCTWQRLIRRKWNMTYKCQYFTIHSSISECDHKCETRNAEPEIRTDGSSSTRRNPRVDGYVSVFGPPRVNWSDFWTGLEPNRLVFAVQIRTAGGLPRPVANTIHVGRSYCSLRIWITLVRISCNSSCWADSADLWDSWSRFIFRALLCCFFVWSKGFTRLRCHIFLARSGSLINCSALFLARSKFAWSDLDKLVLTGTLSQGLTDYLEATLKLSVLSVALYDANPQLLCPTKMYWLSLV